MFPLALQNLARIGTGGRVSVMTPPAALLPFGQQIQDGCNALFVSLCELIGTDPLNGLPLLVPGSAKGIER